MVSFAFDPGVVAAIAVAEALYLRAIRVLRRRGYEVPVGQQAAWHVGIGLVVTGLISPVDTLSEELVSAHMLQHLLIADFAAPFLLAGLRTPVLVFFLPRPVLVPLARRHGLRRLFRLARNPLVAIPLWMVILYGWHLAPPFDAAVRHGWVHALQHASFVIGSLLVWWAAIDPKRGRPPGELWKAGYVLGSRIPGMFLGVAFIVMRSPAYIAAYGESARHYGLSPLADQQIGGGLMLSLDTIVMLAGFAYFFYRAAAEHDRAERAAAATG